MKFSKITGLLLVTLTALGCGSSSMEDPTGKGNIRGINAAVSSPALVFLIGERLLEITEFKGASAATPFDDTQFILNYDYQFAGDTDRTRLATITFNVLPDNDYLYIFTGSIHAPGSILWERPIRAWDNTETVMQIRFGHLSPQLGEVDLYFTAPGTLPVLGNARATLTNGNRSDAVELAAGEYDFFVTGKDDPTDIRFASATTSYPAAIDYLMTLFDTDPSITSPISVRVITENGASIELANTLAPPTLRIIHAAFNTGPVDVYRDNDFSAPLIANVANGDVSATIETSGDVATYSFTPAGNTTVILAEEDFVVPIGLRTSSLLIGPPLALRTMQVRDNVRSVDDTVRLRVLQTANSQQFVDIYVIAFGADLEEALPLFPNIFFQGNSGYVSLPENTYEMYATMPGVKDVLAGPFAFNVDAGDVVHFLMADTVDPNVIQIVKYEHFKAPAPVVGPTP